jgi:hypothetical protein
LLGNKTHGAHQAQSPAAVIGQAVHVKCKRRSCLAPLRALALTVLSYLHRPVGIGVWCAFCSSQTARTAQPRIVESIDSACHSSSPSHIFHVLRNYMHGVVRIACCAPSGSLATLVAPSTAGKPSKKNEHTPAHLGREEEGGGVPDAVAAVVLGLGHCAPAESTLELSIAREEHTAGPLEHTSAYLADNLMPGRYSHTLTRCPAQKVTANGGELRRAAAVGGAPLQFLEWRVH